MLFLKKTKQQRSKTDRLKYLFLETLVEITWQKTQKNVAYTADYSIAKVSQGPFKF